MFISLHICYNVYVFYFKEKIPKILRPAKKFFAFNVAHEDNLSVNLVRRLEKMPTPALEVPGLNITFKSQEIKSMPKLKDLVQHKDLIAN